MGKAIIRARIIYILLAVCVFFSVEAAAQTMRQRAGTAKRNTAGGFDFYGASGNKTGYSRARRNGGYDYYDNQGNKIGSLMPRGKNKKIYSYYNADGIRTGVLRKTTSGSYSYMDIESGKIVNTETQYERDPGSLSIQNLRER